MAAALNPQLTAMLAALDVVQPGLGNEFVAHVGTTMALAAAMPPRLLEGPSPFGGFGDGPASWPDMHIDPDRSWFRAVAAIEDTAAQTAQLEGITARARWGVASFVSHRSV
eukprot:COSAG03_NODE_563_length_6926_cov_121.943899_3_plen_111_part_00